MPPSTHSGPEKKHGHGGRPKKVHKALLLQLLQFGCTQSITWCSFFLNRFCFCASQMRCTFEWCNLALFGQFFSRSLYKVGHFDNDFLQISQDMVHPAARKCKYLLAHCVCAYYVHVISQRIMVCIAKNLHFTMFAQASTDSSTTATKSTTTFEASFVINFFLLHCKAGIVANSSTTFIFSTHPFVPGEFMLNCWRLWLFCKDAQ